ncbi:DUF4176 domain-containing protein [Bacillus spongiae]|uniref:DUF4176 domain-containing protein n=1 Tax=Bacillus spongiae TaxID=2683610 RepID=A0ABU8HGK3_9BACI
MNTEFKEKLKGLAMEKLHQLFYLPDNGETVECSDAILEFADLFLEDEAVMKNLHEAYRQNLPSIDLYSQTIDITYRNEQGLHTIAFLDKKFSLEEASYVDFLSYSIEMMREVLPLGSVVELDPHFFNPDQVTLKPVKVVITGRFILPENYKSFFPYVGVVYPLGEVKKDSTIYFTHPLIESVVHVGYKDELEEAFEVLIKNEMILDKGMKSIEFSTSDVSQLQMEREPEEKAGER